LVKRISVLLFTVIFVILIGQVSASAAGTNNVKDFLGYLKGNEAADLQAKIDKIKTDYSLDVVVVITDKTDGKSSRDYADDYFDYNGYGVGSDHSGILMLVNMGKREVWISTTGRAEGIFTSGRIDAMVDNVTKPLGNGKYNDACNTFINDVRNYAAQGVPSGQHRVESGPGSGIVENTTYLQRAAGLMKSFVVYIIALVIALAATIIASLSSKGKVTINNRTYEEEGSFTLSGTADDFIRDFTTRTEIQSSSSGSGTHTGSSGRSHGGGGGGF
jgi:uncharacterized protein